MAASETPKKIVESGSKCFTCSSPAVNQNKILVFGKTSLNLTEIIRSSLNVDVNCYAENGAELFVCRHVCYKRLQKYQRASEKLEEIRHEIEEAFNSRERPRAKRLTLETADEDMSTNRALKASKSLRFGSAATCISSAFGTRNQTLSTDDTPLPSFLSPPIESHPYRYDVLTASRNQLANSRGLEEFLPGLTSTPASASRNESSSHVKLSVQYPSKNVNKTLHGAYQAIGKALAHGVASQIAGAVMNCQPIWKHIIEKVMKIVSREVTSLCSRKNPSLLRKSEKEDLERFDLELVCNEWRERAPVFYSFLLTSAINKATRNRTWFGSLALAGSVLLKQKNPEMSATATVIGILLKSKAVEATLGRFSKLKLTNTNRHILSTLDKLGEHHDIHLVKTKERITGENSEAHKLQGKFKDLLSMHAAHETCTSACYQEIASARKEEYQLKKSAHPGFIISFDNLDFQLQRKSMSMQSQNRDFHWVNHQMVENRVSGALLDAKGPRPNLKDISNLKFLPTIEDQQRQRSNYIVLTSRILVDHFEVLEPLKDACIQHIPHKYTKEMSQKSKKVPLGIIFKNENVNEDMIVILQHFHSYLPQTGDGGVDGQLFSGDQLTIERAVNVISSVANGYTTQDRLEGINLQLGDWHAAVKLLSLIYSRFFSGKSDSDICSMFADRTLINRRNVTGDPHSSYRANRDFLAIVFKSRVIAAAMKVLGIESRTSTTPTKYSLPANMASLKKLEKIECLHNLSAKVVDEFVFQPGSVVNNLVDEVLTEQEKDILNQQDLTPDGRFPCRFPGCEMSFKYNGKSRRTHELSHDPPVLGDEDATQLITSSKPPTPLKETKLGDDVFNYNCALLMDSFLFFNFLDAIKEGDGARMMRQYKYMMLYCHADGSHSTKYSLECLYQFFLVYALLTPRDSERFIWNRSVNNSGKRGANIPLDEDMEHGNNFIKQGIKNLGPNLSEKAVSRLSYSQSPTASILGNLDETIKRLSRSGKHSTGSLESDLDELIKRAVEFHILDELEGRSYKHFANFKRDRLESLNASRLYQWINKHKKYITWGIRAR